MPLAGCCCCSLKQGCLILAYIQLVGISLFTLYFCIRQIPFLIGQAQSNSQYSIIEESAFENTKQVIGKITEYVKPIIYICHFTVIPFIDGVKKNKPDSMYPWIVVVGVTFFFDIIAFLINTIFIIIEWGFQSGALVIHFLLAAYSAYQLAVIVSYYNMVKKRNCQQSSEEEVIAETNI